MKADPLRAQLTRVVGGAAALFQDIERTGPPIPDGPVLVAANHVNALLDPLVLFHTAGRPTRPLAKAPLFTHPLIGPFLKAWAACRCTGARTTRR